MRLLFLLDQTCFCFSFALSLVFVGISQTLKKGQKKSKNKNKNESDQEETTDAWGFEKPSTSGIPQTPQKVKTISWKQVTESNF
jgi:hypothetical protein